MLTYKQNLAEIRTSKGFSIRKAATKCGLSASCIWRLENNISKNKEHMRKYQTFLGITELEVKILEKLGQIPTSSYLELNSFIDQLIARNQLNKPKRKVIEIR